MTCHSNPFTHRSVSLLVLAGLTLLLPACCLGGGPVAVFDAETLNPYITSGPHFNPGEESIIADVIELDYPDADCIRLLLSSLVLNHGDTIRIVSHADTATDFITVEDPEYPTGAVYSCFVNGGDVDIEFVVGPQSSGAQLTLSEIVIARYIEEEVGVLSRCGSTDDRVAFADACCMRIWWKARGKVWYGSGFMIGPNCMLTCNHCMIAGEGPWHIERNVPKSAGGTGRPFASKPEDRFRVANLTGSVTSGTNDLGRDWAVIKVPNNAKAKIPGAGCTPTFNCTFKPTVPGGVNMTVAGHGSDTTPKTNNYTLQTHTGPAVAAGGTYYFKYRTDTMGASSGSRVTDDAGAIVGIHKLGACDGVDPETGSNAGTIIYRPELVEAIQTVCGMCICGSGPSSLEATSWGAIKALHR